MSWIIGFFCFLFGAAAGALAFRTLRSDEVRVRQLEVQLRELSEEHETYKSGVHSHFSSTARLLNDMTDSYRKVYLHLASGAQTLCPDYISDQLNLSSEARALLERSNDEPAPPAPPLDYAARDDARSSGSLAEDYGFDRARDA